MSQEVRAGSRNHNIDCLKCLLMLGVMSLHTVIHGFGFAQSLHSGEYIWRGISSLFELIVMCIANVSVNIYFLISGYYGIKFKRRRAFQLFEIMVFYSIMTYIIAIALGIEHFGIISAIKYGLLGWRSYWFMIVYLIIYLFSDIINGALDRLNESQWKRFLIIYFCLNTFLGFVLNSSEYGSALSTIPMVFLYCSGYYIRKFGFASKIGKWWIYICSTLLNFFICLVLLYIRSWNWAYDFSVDYCNPFIVISAVSLFSMVTLMKKKVTTFGSVVSYIAPYTIAVYLFTETVLARKWAYWGLSYIQDRIGSLSILIYAISIYICAVAIEIIRVKVFDYLGKVFKKKEKTK